jgi:thioredoxin 2
MADSTHLVCPHCAATNRIPTTRLNEAPKCGQCHQALFTGHPAELGSASFRKFIERNDVPVVVDFWAPWCIPCRAQEAPLAAAAASLGDKVRIVRVNIRWNPVHALRYKVQALPTTLVFMNGELVDRSTGVLSAEEIQDLVARTAADSARPVVAAAGDARAAAPGTR